MHVHARDLSVTPSGAQIKKWVGPRRDAMRCDTTRQTTDATRALLRRILLSSAMIRALHTTQHARFVYTTKHVSVASRENTPSWGETSREIMHASGSSLLPLGNDLSSIQSIATGSSESKARGRGKFAYVHTSRFVGYVASARGHGLNRINFTQ